VVLNKEKAEQLAVRAARWLKTVVRVLNVVTTDKVLEELESNMEDIHQCDASH
jgi:hypothetical protein